MELGRGFASAVAHVAGETGVRAVLICGSGRILCPGRDVAAMGAAEDPGRYLLDLTSAVHPAFLTLAELPVPVVAAVQGAAAGAGLAMTLASDIVIAADSARFLTAYGSIELRLTAACRGCCRRWSDCARPWSSLSPDAGWPRRRPSSWGLGTIVVAEDDVRAEGLRMAQNLADGPARAHGVTRRLMRAWPGRSSRTICTPRADPFPRWHRPPRRPI